MGSSQSYLYIYLNSKEFKYNENGYTVDVSKSVYSGCKYFDVVTHKITYKPGNGTNFDIYLYNGVRGNPEGKYVFAYCSPSDKQVVNQINVYFSVLAPNTPLVISFVTKGNHTYNCLYTYLNYYRWDYASKITSYTFKEELLKKLFESYKNYSLNRTIHLLKDSPGKTTVSNNKQNIDNDGTFKLIYYPVDNNSSMGIGELFKSLNPSGVKNQLDYSYLSEVINRYFSGILVHCTKDNMALVLEFIADCKTNQYIRCDKDGTYWVSDDFNYTDNKSLKSKLDDLEKKANENDIVTYMLDRFVKYNEVDVQEDKTKKTTYTKYNHKPSQPKKPNLIFGGKQIKEINDKLKEKKPKSLDVYYLKTKTTNDTAPFLLVFNENDTKTPENKPEKQPPEQSASNPKTSEEKQCFLFSNTYNVYDWEELSDCTKLEGKLTELENKSQCYQDLTILRAVAHQILTQKTKEPEIKKEPAVEQRPQVLQPKYVETAEDIVGYVSGGLFVSGVTGVGGYGIYWYNTTIKLLT